MALAIGSDHAGFSLKQILCHYFQSQHIEFLDIGCHTDERVDYPDFAMQVARLVSKGTCERGIVLCGTGIGVAIVANKVRGIRAALCCTEFMAEMARKHNDANILALGGRTTSAEMALKIVNIFLHTPFADEHHSLRVEKIHSLTNR